MAKKTNIVIEVGVNQGQHTQGLRDKYNVPVHGFEPVPQLQKKLQQLFKSDDDIHLYPFAVDIKDGTSKFNIQSPGGKYGTSSLYDFTKGIHQMWNKPRFHHSEQVEVTTTRIDTFLDKLEVTNVLYLHCDAQGNDLNVLRSFGKYIDVLDAGVIEVAHTVELYSGNNNTTDIAQTWLEHHGFLTDVRPDAQNKEANIHFERKK